MQRKKAFSCAVFLIYVGMWFLGWQTAVFTTSGYIKDKKVAITFDDGPCETYTECLLDGLKERNVAATFFVIGEEAQQNPQIIKRMQEEGHTIGNHTYTHVNLCELCDCEVIEQINKTNEVVEQITGEKMVFIRPPYGAWSDALEEKTGMIAVLWDVDPRDWEIDDTGLIIERVLAQVEDGSILLFHDSSDSSVAAALAVVDILTEKGYDFVSVDEILFD